MKQTNLPRRQSLAYEKPMSKTRIFYFRLFAEHTQRFQYRCFTFSFKSWNILKFRLADVNLAVRSMQPIARGKGSRQNITSAMPPTCTLGSFSVRSNSHHTSHLTKLIYQIRD